MGEVDPPEASTLNSETRRGANTGPATTTAAVVVVLVALAAAGLALRSTSKETDVLPGVTLPDPIREPAAAVVIGRHRSGGISLLGLDFGEVTRTVSVEFYAPAGCFDRVAEGDPWPTPVEECAVAVPIAGIVSGGGIAATGQSIVEVDVTVGEDCYQSIDRGDSWPPATDACDHPAG